MSFVTFRFDFERTHRNMWVMSMFPSSDNNSTGVELFMSYWNAAAAFWLEFVNLVHTNPTVSFELESSSLQFSEFQWTLLRGFTITLIVNLVLVCIAWKVYGAGICERFMKPGKLFHSYCSIIRNLFDSYIQSYRRAKSERLQTKITERAHS